MADALNEAEHDHFIDCPNADMFTRLEAGVLDCIFLLLMGSGLDLFSAVRKAVPRLRGAYAIAVVSAAEPGVVVVHVKAVPWF